MGKNREVPVTSKTPHAGEPFEATAARRKTRSNIFCLEHSLVRSTHESYNRAPVPQAREGALRQVSGRRSLAMVLRGHSRRSGTAHPFTQRAGAVSRALIRTVLWPSDESVLIGASRCQCRTLYGR